MIKKKKNLLKSFLYTRAGFLIKIMIFLIIYFVSGKRTKVYETNLSIFDEGITPTNLEECLEAWKLSYKYRFEIKYEGKTFVDIVGF